MRFLGASMISLTNNNCIYQVIKRIDVEIRLQIRRRWVWIIRHNHTWWCHGWNGRTGHDVRCNPVSVSHSHPRPVYLKLYEQCLLLVPVVMGIRTDIFLVFFILLPFYLTKFSIEHHIFELWWMKFWGF
jgi:hypothetical protein